MKLGFKCSHCGYQFYLNGGNLTLVRHTEEPMYDHAEIICDECEKFNVVFGGEEFLAMVGEYGGSILRETAEEPVRLGWREINSKNVYNVGEADQLEAEFRDELAKINCLADVGVWQ